MAKRVEIITKKEIFKKFIFRIEEVHLRHEKFDGSMSDEIVRLNLDRSDSVAAVIHDVEADTLILTEQFRYSTYEKGEGWMLELPAGIAEHGEEPEEAMRRELVEEIGYSVKKLEHISTFYLSPGGTSERIFLYYAAVENKEQTHDGGGLAAEGEDIRIIELSVKDALAKISTGEVVDAKTIVGLQWLQINKQK